MYLFCSSQQHELLRTRRAMGHNNAIYMKAIHQEMADRVKEVNRPSEVKRNQKVIAACEQLEQAFNSVDITNNNTKEAEKQLDALHHYMFNLGKCEVKNIYGYGRPFVEDCVDYAFYMVDPMIRNFINPAYKEGKL